MRLLLKEARSKHNVILGLDEAANLEGLPRIGGTGQKKNPLTLLPLVREPSQHQQDGKNTPKSAWNRLRKHISAKRFSAGSERSMSGSGLPIPTPPPLPHETASPLRSSGATYSADGRPGEASKRPSLQQELSQKSVCTGILPHITTFARMIFVANLGRRRFRTMKIASILISAIQVRAATRPLCVYELEAACCCVVGMYPHGLSLVPQVEARALR